MQRFACHNIQTLDSLFVFFVQTSRSKSVRISTTSSPFVCFLVGSHVFYEVLHWFSLE